MDKWCETSSLSLSATCALLIYPTRLTRPSGPSRPLIRLIRLFACPTRPTRLIVQFVVCTHNPRLSSIHNAPSNTLHSSTLHSHLTTTHPPPSARTIVNAGLVVAMCLTRRTEDAMVCHEVLGFSCCRTCRTCRTIHIVVVQEKKKEKEKKKKFSRNNKFFTAKETRNGEGTSNQNPTDRCDSLSTRSCRV